LSQSLNPWWLHLRQNPYKNRAEILNQSAKNSYSLAVKNTLLTCIQNYISLRKLERNQQQLADTLAVYDELMDAYQKMQSGGNISWRDYYDVRNDKWKYEQDLFALENELNTIQGNIFQVTGIQATNVRDEPLPAITDALFMHLFFDIQKSEVSRLEEWNIYLQKELLQIGKILDRQTNAPKLKIDFGTSFQLPAQKTGSLDDAWKKEYFDDNKLNNWTVSIGFDLSNLFTPLNKKNTLIHDIEINTLNELLKTIDKEKEKQKTAVVRMIAQLLEQIDRLAVIVATEEKNIQEDAKMKERGVITELEYKQSVLVYSEKNTLLQNLKDELWLYRFIGSFYL
jgi:hypothetical protein